VNIILLILLSNQPKEHKKKLFFHGSGCPRLYQMSCIQKAMLYIDPCVVCDANKGLEDNIGDDNQEDIESK